MTKYAVNISNVHLLPFSISSKNKQNDHICCMGDVLNIYFNLFCLMFVIIPTKEIHHL